MFDNLKDMGKLLKQAKEMKSRMTKVQEQLKRETLTAEAAGGKITVKITGELDIIDISIAEDLLAPANKKNLERDVKNVINDAINKAKTMASEKLSAVSGDMQLPNMG